MSESIYVLSEHCSPQEYHKFSAQAAEDWKTILKHRQTELCTGKWQYILKVLSI